MPLCNITGFRVIDLVILKKKICFKVLAIYGHDCHFRYVA